MGSARAGKPTCTCRRDSRLIALLLFGPASLTMSNDREVARALNNLVRESRALFGGSDSHALSEFVTEYLCGDDPVDSDDGK